MNALVPDGVIMRTCDAPPALSTPCAVVTIENSPTLSEVGRFGTKSSELVRMKLSWMLMPSCVTCVQVGRPPLMAVLVRPRLAHAGLQLDQRNRIPAVQRQRHDLLLLDGRRDFRVVVGTSDVPASTVTFSLTSPSSSRAVSEYS